jgi:hypothetical protein
MFAGQNSGYNSEGDGELVRRYCPHSEIRMSSVKGSANF